MSRDVRGACALYYSYQVRGADGRIRVPFQRRTSHSFLKAYAQWLYLKMGRALPVSVVDTSNTSRSVVTWSTLNTATAAGTATEGLVVGTGTNAVALADYQLQTRIVHGTSSGQLQYGASVVELPSSTSTDTTLIMTRPFSNASGGSITVKEIGIYSTMAYGSGSTTQFCTVRDLATIALANGDVLTLNYILKTTA